MKKLLSVLLIVLLCLFACALAADVETVVPPANFSVGIGETFRIIPTAKDVNGNTVSTTWSFTSSNTNVLYVTATGGTVKGKAKGTATVTIKAANGKKATIDVKVVSAATGIKLDHTTLGMNVNDTKTLTVSFPSGYSKTRSWYSSNTSVATVSSNGTVTAHANGTATITVKTFNEKSATCKVTVGNMPDSVTVDVESFSIGIGETFKIVPHAWKGSTEISTSWSFTSNNTNSVYVTAEGGTVKGKASGTATVTVKAPNGVSKTVNVKVVSAATGIQLSKTSIGLEPGSSTTLSVSFPSGYSRTRTWSSSNTAVATVDQSGKITAVSKGTATITVKTFNDKTAACKVYVDDMPDSVSVEVSSLSLGVGETFKIVPHAYKGSTAVSTPWTFTSSDSSVLYVTAEGGTMKAKARGNATVTVKAVNGISATVSVKIVAAATDVILSKDILGFSAANQSETLTVSFTNGYSRSRTWKSSDSSIVKVDQNGKVTAVGNGIAVISVETFNGKRDTCRVLVGTMPTEVSVNKTNVKLGVGEAYTIVPTAKNGSTTLTKMIWSFKAADPSVLTVNDETGVVKGAKVGTTLVTVTAPNGLNAAVKFTVAAAPTRVSFAENTSAKYYNGMILMKVNETLKLTPVFASGYSRTQKWSSSNKSAVTVDGSGNIKAVAAGTARITMTTYNSKVATVNVCIGSQALLYQMFTDWYGTPDYTATWSGGSNRTVFDFDNGSVGLGCSNGKRYYWAASNVQMMRNLYTLCYAFDTVNNLDSYAFEIDVYADYESAALKTATQAIHFANNMY